MKGKFEAQIKPQSFKDGKFDVVFSTGASRKMKLSTGEIVNEILDMSESAIDLTRLQGIAPFLANHGREHSDVLGKVERGWVENGVGHATIKLSKRDEIKSTREDIEDGIRTSVSVGYEINEAKRKGKDFVVTRWHPTEISLVPIGADARAQVRSYDGTLAELDHFTDDKPAEPTPPVSPVTPPPTQKTETRNMSEREKYRRYFEIATRGKLTQEDALKAIESDESEDAFVKRSFENLAKITNHGVSAITDIRPANGGREGVRAAIENAIEHRLFHTDLTDHGKKYAHRSLLEYSRDMIGALGENSEGYTKNEIATRALSTSDFPLILESIANKRLAKSIKLATPTYGPLVSMRTLPDFKDASIYQMTELPALLLMPEGTSVKYATFGESKQTYRLASWGRAIRYTRQMIINDDLSAFDKIPTLFAPAIQNVLSEIAWGEFLSNKVMGDGIPVFDKRHNNLLPPKPPTLESIDEARLLMGNQRGAEKTTFLDIRAAYIIVPPKMEFKVSQLMSAPNATTVGDFNPLAGRFKVISDPRLEGDTWYMAASISDIPIIEMAYLEGNVGPKFATNKDFETDAVSLKCNMDVGGGLIEWRGLVKVGN